MSPINNRAWPAVCEHSQRDRIYSPENGVWCCGGCGDSGLPAPCKTHMCTDCMEEWEPTQPSLAAVLRRGAQRWHGLSEDPIHMQHVFRDCPDEYCVEVRTALGDPRADGDEILQAVRDSLRAP